MKSNSSTLRRRSTINNSGKKALLFGKNAGAGVAQSRAATGTLFGEIVII